MEKRNVYENIVAEIRTLIEVGALKEGEKLPSVRAYAVERKVNPNTVAKAYTALEESGFIEVQLKKGAFVKMRKKEERSWQAELKTQMTAFKEKGVTRAQAEEILREVFAETEGEKK